MGLVSCCRALQTGDAPRERRCDDRCMLNQLSTQFADLVDAAAPSVVQVQGRRRPASGIVYSPDVVLTTMRALGREDGLRVRRHDGRAVGQATLLRYGAAVKALFRKAWVNFA